MSAFAEVLSIGAALPFLGALAAPNRVFDHSLAQPFVHALGIQSAEQVLLPLTLAFVVAVLVAGGVRLLLLWASTRFSFATGADLSISIYRRTLYQPYVTHVSRNSSEIVNGILTKVGAVTNTTMTLLGLIASSVTLVTILMLMLYVDTVMAMVAFGSFGLIYGCIGLMTRKRLLENSRLVADESTRVVKVLQEGLGGIRDVLVDSSQAAYCQIYRNAELPLRRAQGSSAFISASPRYVVEALGMMLIAALAYVLVQQTDGVAKAIPVLGTLALGAQRLLPALQQTYAGWSSIRAGQTSLQDALNLLDQALPDYAGQPAALPMPFHQSIALNQVSFQYTAQAPWVIENFSFAIPKGSRIGFIGATGSGKSTLVDILMGLLQPTHGEMAIDGKSVTSVNTREWQAHIAHVPQAIFLTDSSIEENIAFGQPVEQIDRERMLRAARQAQIADLIETWPLQYQTIVGERGVRLSGGQRQRIGIARALYKQADVIIFDEATSALDTETEEAVMQSIEGLSEHLTILIIAHRITTLKSCTQIVELGEGGIKRVGSYQEIVGQNQGLITNTHAL